MDKTDLHSMAARLDILLTLLHYPAKPSFVSRLQNHTSRRLLESQITALKAASLRFNLEVDDYTVLAVNAAVMQPERVLPEDFGSREMVRAIRYGDYAALYTDDPKERVSFRRIHPARDALVSLIWWMRTYGKQLSELENKERYQFIVCTRTGLHPVWLYDAKNVSAYWQVTKAALAGITRKQAADLHTAFVSDIALFQKSGAFRQWYEVVDSKYGETQNGRPHGRGSIRDTI